MMGVAVKTIAITPGGAGCEEAHGVVLAAAVEKFRNVWEDLQITCGDNTGMFVCVLYVRMIYVYAVRSTCIAAFRWLAAGSAALPPPSLLRCHHATTRQVLVVATMSSSCIT